MFNDDFADALNNLVDDPDALVLPDSYRRLNLVHDVHNGKTNENAQYRREDEVITANIRIVGNIADAAVGTYGTSIERKGNEPGKFENFQKAKQEILLDVRGGFGPETELGRLARSQAQNLNQLYNRDEFPSDGLGGKPKGLANETQPWIKKIPDPSNPAKEIWAIVVTAKLFEKPNYSNKPAEPLPEDLFNEAPPDDDEGMPALADLDSESNEPANEESHMLDGRLTMETWPNPLDWPYQSHPQASKYHLIPIDARSVSDRPISRTEWARHLKPGTLVLVDLTARRWAIKRGNDSNAHLSHIYHLIPTQIKVLKAVPDPRLAMPAPPPRDDAPASPSKRKAEDHKDFIMLSPAPKRPFPVTPSRAAKFSGASASAVKGTDAMAIDGSPSGQSWKSDRKERPTTPTPTARSTRGSRAAGGSSAVSK